MPAMRMIRLFPGQGLLLASDGFYKALSEELIGEALSGRINGREGLEKRLRTLAEEGMKRGSKDHISAVYLCKK